MSHDKVERQCRPHPNDAKHDGGHAGKPAFGVERRPRIAESPDTAYGEHYQISENVRFVL